MINIRTLSVSLIGLIGFLSPVFLLANQSNDTETEVEENSQSVDPDQADQQFQDFIVDQSSFGPTTQQEANLLVDQYIQSNFEDVYHTETISVGEMKILVKDKYLFTNQNIDFAVVTYHIDKSLSFEGATYTWNVKQGDNNILTVKETNKTGFFYNFTEPGIYQVEVIVEFGDEIIKQGLMTLDVFDKIDIDYRPLNPAKNDIITLSTNADISGNFTWIVDSEEVEGDKKELSFQEFKGIGGTYDVELIIKNPATNKTQYYGASQIKINPPEVRFTLTNQETGEPIDYRDSLRIEEFTKLAIVGNVDNLGQDARPVYTFRVNDRVVDSNQESLELEINPALAYRVSLVVDDVNSEQIVRRSFDINHHKKDLQANIDEATQSRGISERYWGLIIFGIIGILGIVLSVFGKPKSIGY